MEQQAGIALNQISIDYNMLVIRYFRPSGKLNMMIATFSSRKSNDEVV